MAFSCYVDAFSVGSGAAGTTVVRTGYGFAPKACIYLWSGSLATTDLASQNDIRLGIGFATSATDRRLVTVQSDHGAGTMATDRRHSNSACIETLNISGTVEGSLDVQSFDSDGQTLVVDTAFTPQHRIQCLALGGSDLTNAETFQFQASTFLGNADFTGLSFQPDAIVLTSIGHNAAPPATTTTNSLMLGLATASSQAALAWIDVDAGGSSDTASYARTDECLAFITSATSLFGRAQFVSFLSNGFRLNWTQGAPTPLYIHGLALKGGQYRLGSFTTSAVLNTTQAQSGFGFVPTGAFFASHSLALSTSGTLQVGQAGTLGAMSSASNRGAVGWASTDASNSAACWVITDHDACAALVTSGAGANSSFIDISSIDSDGFTTIIDDAGAAAELIYLAFGSSGGAPPTADILPQMMHQHGG
jgi:hypothetical protein